MKLNNRLHNISLNLHTVSGVILCVVLFVIFYCGAFTLFKKDISNWESRIDYGDEIPVGAHLIDSAYIQLDEEGIYHKASVLFYDFKEKSNFRIFTAGDSANSRKLFKVIDQVEEMPVRNTYNDLLYDLHFLRPIPMIGVTLAGLVSVFFVFSIFSGTLIHLKNFFRDFFMLRKKKKPLTFFKDSHIVMGVITLPFQLIYAVSGGVFCILVYLVLPQVLVQFKGDTSQMEAYFEDVQPTLEVTGEPYHFDDISTLVLSFEEENDVELTYAWFYNFGDENMQLLLNGEKDEINRRVRSLYTVKTGERASHLVSTEAPLVDQMNNWLSGLHYATFGGFLMKLVYLILALISCIVFYSGGLLWLESRKKKVRRLNFYFEGIIWGLVVSTLLCFLVRYFTPGVSIIFYPFWFIWSIFAFFVSREKFLKISKWTGGIFVILFIGWYFFSEDINHLSKLTLPLVVLISYLALILYKQTPLLKLKKTQEKVE